ncbi:MAG TPA: DUF6455 family protein [Woeseiaceae bacterium]|nr:DUF6455 family protein [Woeseiaceae bacterium]
MLFPDSHITLVTILAVFLSAVIAAWRWRQSKAVRRRITRMMLTFGIDGATARDADALLDIDMDAVRRRCRRCPSPATCERWLNGETVPGNDFCPNAPQFAAVVQVRQCRLRYAPGHRPGRRLDG